MLYFFHIIFSLFFKNHHKNHKNNKYYFKIKYNFIGSSLFLLFAFFLLITIITADSIPLLVSFQGGSVSEISESRAAFLKGRVGFFSFLVYVNGFLSAFIIPYMLVILYHEKSKVFLPFVIIFFIYTLLSTEKALFLRVIIPFIGYFSILYKNEKNPYLIKKISKFMIFSIALLLLNTVISGFGQSNNVEIDISIASFFNADFSSEIIDAGPFLFFIWRSFAIPIITAVDSFHAFSLYFNDSYLWGATNGTLSFLLDLNRVWFERMVFEYQWGQADEGTMSANAVFFIEAFVNFSYIGVVIYSFLVAYIYFKIQKNTYYPLMAISPLITYNLFSSGLLGTLFSNGLIFLIIFNKIIIKKINIL